MLSHHVKEMTMKARMPAYTTGDIEEVISGTKDALAKFNETIGSGFVVGPNLTWLDFVFAEQILYLEKATDGLVGAQNPVLREYLDRFLTV